VNPLRKTVPALVLAALASVGAAGSVKAPATKGPAARTPTPTAGIYQQQRFYAPVYKREMYGTQLSVNDRCAVKHGPLNAKIRPTYVNGQPVGFC
jgi:hypothetical protein